MFDYEKFENDVVSQMIIVFNKWAQQNDDLYIFSLYCAEEMDSIGVIANTAHFWKEQADEDPKNYWYYKYCEEEWDLWNTFEAASADMRSYKADSEDEFDKHFNEIIKHCINALIRFKKSISENHSDILLTFNIREYLDGIGRIEIFKSLNSEAASKEYSEHIDDYA